MAKEQVKSAHTELADLLSKTPKTSGPAKKAPGTSKLGKNKTNATPDSGIVKFNTRAAVRKYLSEEKTEILFHPARKKVLCGAKNSGKSIVAIIWQIFTMETDPMVSHVSARKHQGSAKKRLGEHFASTIVALRNMGFYFPYDYEVTQQYISKAQYKSNVQNQKIEFASFGDTDGLAGIQVGNGGYIAGIHYEEPSQLGDKGVDFIDDEKWRKSTKNIRNSAGRLQKTIRSD